MRVLFSFYRKGNRLRKVKQLVQGHRCGESRIQTWLTICPTLCAKHFSRLPICGIYRLPKRKCYSSHFIIHSLLSLAGSRETLTYLQVSIKCLFFLKIRNNTIISSERGKQPGPTVTTVLSWASEQLLFFSAPYFLNLLKVRKLFFLHKQI